MQQSPAGKMNTTEFYKHYFNTNLLNNESVIELDELTRKFPWFQLAWILYLKNLKQINSPEYENILKQVAVKVGSRKLLFDYLNSSDIPTQIPINSGQTFSIKEDRDSSNSTSGDSLIDRFLSSDMNSIRRKLPVQENTENDHKHILEKSESEDDELITETLANIYLQQKNYEKAIYAFEKLSLKYPEKSIYFASRIKEAEDLKKL